MKGIESIRENFSVSRETGESLSTLVDCLLEWQKKTNLVAPSTLDEIWSRHIADSLQCITLKPDARNWLDLGSGGGFPGLVIAAMMAQYSDASVSLVESNAKKTAFLRQTNRRMGANARVFTSRIEKLPDIKPAPEVVTARALASLDQLFKLASPWLSTGAVGLFHKGRDFQKELELCDGLWHFDLIVHQSLVQSDSVILEISNLKAG